MAQFDAVENRSGFLTDAVPYFLDIQNDFISGTGTRVVVPLRLTTRAGPLIKRLNPVFEIGNKQVAMMTLEVASLSNSAFGRTIGTLEAEHDEIIAAIDFLISGF